MVYIYHIKNPKSNDFYLVYSSFCCMNIMVYYSIIIANYMLISLMKRGGRFMKTIIINGIEDELFHTLSSSERWRSCCISDRVIYGLGANALNPKL